MLDNNNDDLKSGYGEIQILTFISMRALYVMVI